MWCVSMSVIVLVWDGNPLHTGVVGLVLSFVSCTYVWWFLHGRNSPPFMCMLCLLPILSEHRLWLDGKWFCLFDIRFVDDFWYGLTYNVVSCTIQHGSTKLHLRGFIYRCSFIFFLNMENKIGKLFRLLYYQG